MCSIPKLFRAMRLQRVMPFSLPDNDGVGQAGEDGFKFGGARLNPLLEFGVELAHFAGQSEQFLVLLQQLLMGNLQLLLRLDQA